MLKKTIGFEQLQKEVKESIEEYHKEHPYPNLVCPDCKHQMIFRKRIKNCRSETKIYFCFNCNTYKPITVR